MLNERSVKGHAPVGHPLSMVSQIESWNLLSVWCPCHRARSLIGSFRLDFRSDNGKQQLDDHVEVPEDIVLSIILLSMCVVCRRFLDHAT